jgi:CRP/FNR family transcriptional regulator
MPYLIRALGHSDSSIQGTAAGLLAEIGEPAIEPVLAALQSPAQEEGALLALQGLPTPPEKPIEEYARITVARAVEYDRLLRGIQSVHPGPETQDGVSQDECNQAIDLLAESLTKKSNQYGVRALRAIGLLGDRDAMNLSIDILSLPHSTQRANVIEALESIHTRWRKIIQPLMHLWEDTAVTAVEPAGKDNWQRLMADEDSWIRECALFAAHKLGGVKMENIVTLALMERILFLKRVSLFENLSPGDIKQVAAIAQEEAFSDGVTLVREGEIGDVMFIIVSGEVRVFMSRGQREIELARRKTGDSVGEMALISKEPRSATVTAIGNVRTLCIDQKSFESLLRDRPDVSLAVIQVLCKRLRESDIKLHLSNPVL